MSQPTMKKSQLISSLAEETGLTKKQVSDFLDILMKISIQETKKTGSFTFPGLGKMVLRKRPKRKGRNPRTGEEIIIPAKTIVKFNLSKSCKDLIVNSKK